MLLKVFKGSNLPSLIRMRTIDGVLIDIDPLNYMDQFVLKYGYYEREVLDALSKLLNGGGVLWDVGANIGLHAITSKILFPETSVVCFEPSPYNFTRLYANMVLNNCDMVLLNVALSDHSGYEHLSMNVRGHHGVTSLKPWDWATYEFSFPCRCERGTVLVNNGTVPKPSVIKIDVENYEFEVLLGIEELLHDTELKGIIYEDQSQDAMNSPIHETLVSKGFQISPLSPSNFSEKSKPTNFLAAR